MKKSNVSKIVFISIIAVLLIVLLAVLFTADTVTVEYNSLGGAYNGDEYVLVNPYTEQPENNVNANAYNQVHTVTVRKNAVLSQPEPSRDGYTFDGWYLANIADDGTVTYGERFEDKTLRSLDIDPDSTVSVYAKWKAVESNGDSEGLFKKPSKQSVLGALQIMWKGMLGIFLVLGIIFICIVALNTLTNPEKRAKLFGKNKSSDSDGSNQ